MASRRGPRNLAQLDGSSAAGSAERAFLVRKSEKVKLTPIAAEARKSRRVLRSEMSLGGIGRFSVSERFVASAKAKRLMPKVAHPGKHHRQAVLVAGFDRILVAHRAARLDDGFHTGLGGHIN